MLAGFILAAAANWLLLFCVPPQLRAQERRHEQMGALAKEMQL